jgi:hypothetical protein
VSDEGTLRAEALADLVAAKVVERLQAAERHNPALCPISHAESLRSEGWRHPIGPKSPHFRALCEHGAACGDLGRELLLGFVPWGIWPPEWRCGHLVDLEDKANIASVTSANRELR